MKFATIPVVYVPFCLRKAFFTIRFNSKPPFSENQKYGKELHTNAAPKIMKDIIKEEHYQLEVPCSYSIDGWTVRGRADAVSTDAVYEFKFTGNVHSAPFASAAMQTAAYCKMLHRKRCYVVFVDRNDTSNVNICNVSNVEKKWDSFLGRAEALVHHLQCDEIPDIHSPTFHWECKNCQWKIVCARLR